MDVIDIEIAPLDEFIEFMRKTQYFSGAINT